MKRWTTLLVNMPPAADGSVELTRELRPLTLTRA